MKRLFIIIFISLSAFATANAQSANSTHYRDLKGSYNFKEYEKQATDPYNAGWYECASFFVPGVGQLLSGEVGRGIAFIAGEAILMSIVAETASTIKEIAITNDKGFLIGYTDEKKGKTNMAVMLSALGVDLGLAIWSSIDASRIAKVKNMYYQDLIGNDKPIELAFSPAVSFVPSQSGSMRPSAGLAVQVRF
jgi:hypothetical protein